LGRGCRADSPEDGGPVGLGRRGFRYSEGDMGIAT
jgi:hypothetical protein